MCIQITGILPLETEIENIKGLLEEYDFEFSVIHNQAIVTQLSKDEVYYKVTKYGCDCDTGLGKYEVYNMNFDSKLELSNKSDLDETFINSLRQDFNDRNKGYKTDVKKWGNFIKRILGNNEIHRIGILLHFYEQGYEFEKFKIKEIKKYKVNQVNSDLLLKLEEDILYFFSKWQNDEQNSYINVVGVIIS